MGQSRTTPGTIRAALARQRVRRPQPPADEYRGARGARARRINRRRQSSRGSETRAPPRRCDSINPKMISVFARATRTPPRVGPPVSSACTRSPTSRRVLLPGVYGQRRCRFQHGSEGVAALLQERCAGRRRPPALAAPHQKVNVLVARGDDAVLADGLVVLAARSAHDADRHAVGKPEHALGVGGPRGPRRRR